MWSVGGWLFMIEAFTASGRCRLTCFLFDALAQHFSRAAEHGFDAVGFHVELGREFFAAEVVAIKPVDGLPRSSFELLQTIGKRREESGRVVGYETCTPNFFGGGEFYGADLAAFAAAGHQQLVTGNRAEVDVCLPGTLLREFRTGQGEEGFLREVVGIAGRGPQVAQVSPNFGLMLANQLGQIHGVGLHRRWLAKECGHANLSAAGRGKGFRKIKK